MPYRSPDRHAITPQLRGRFPDFDVLDQVDVWDDVTAGVVLARLTLPGTLAFFSPHEAGVAAPLLDLMLAQNTDPRIPVLALIDDRLATGETDGWHYDEMPEDGRAWRDTLALLDRDAQARQGCGFAELPAGGQAVLVQSVQDLAAGGGQWHEWSAEHTWSLWTRYACTAFYSHPWAWNEIGFGGPAYPRGYLNLGIDAREKWEVSDHVGGDPVPFSGRVEAARQEHAQQLGQDGET